MFSFFLDAFYVLSAPWTRCSLGRTGIVWKSISSVNYWRFSWVYFFLGGLSCGEANARMGDCESGPIAACLFLLSVLSFVSLQQPQGRWIGRNVLSGILSPTDTAIAVLDSLNIFLLANQELPHHGKRELVFSSPCRPSEEDAIRLLSLSLLKLIILFL